MLCVIERDAPMLCVIEGDDADYVIDALFSERLTPVTTPVSWFYLFIFYLFFTFFLFILLFFNFI